MGMRQSIFQSIKGLGSLLTQREVVHPRPFPASSCVCVFWPGRPVPNLSCDLVRSAPEDLVKIRAGPFKRQQPPNSGHFDQLAGQ